MSKQLGRLEGHKRKNHRLNRLSAALKPWFFIALVNSKLKVDRIFCFASIASVEAGRQLTAAHLRPHLWLCIRPLALNELLDRVIQGNLFLLSYLNELLHYCLLKD